MPVGFGMPEAWEVVSVVAIFLFVLLLALLVVGLADLMRAVGQLLRIALPLSGNALQLILS